MQNASLFETICLSYRDCIRRQVLEAGVPPGEVDDVLHEVLVAVHGSLHTYDAGRSHLATWLRAVARNTAADYLYHWRKIQTRAPDDAVLLETAWHGPSSEEWLIEKEQRRFLCDTLARMRPELRVVLVHRELLGLTSSEVARVLGLSEPTVRSQYERAMRELKSAFKRWRASQSWRTGACMLPLSVGALFAREREWSLSAADTTRAQAWARVLRVLAEQDSTGQHGPHELRDSAVSRVTHEAPEDAVRALPAPARPSRYAPVRTASTLRRVLRSRIMVFAGGSGFGGFVVWLLLRPYPPPPPPVLASPRVLIVGAADFGDPSVGTPDLPTLISPQLARTPLPLASAWLAPATAEPPRVGSPAVDPTHSVPAVQRSALRPGAPAATSDREGAEAAMMTGAQEAMDRGDFAAAGGLLDLHAHDFPNGKLKVHREALRGRLPH